jgi:tRNA (cmo5U34)-methyltransferase
VSLEQFHFDPATYSAIIREELPVYDQIQDAVGNATADRPSRRILDLGAGTGATARAVQQRHPSASFVLFDESPEMLAVANDTLGDAPIERVLIGDLLGPIPDGPFDLVVSALAIHHLPGTAKRDLFLQVRSALSSSGRFVLADVVVPANPDDAVTPLSEGYDHPSSLPELTAWLADAGFTAAVTWQWKDIVVMRCDPR